MAEKAKFIYKGQEFDFGIIEGTDGNKAIDMTKLRASTGLWSYDPGFANTAASQSSITYLDGENGVLRYRGYPIEEIAEKATFVETATGEQDAAKKDKVTAMNKIFEFNI